MIWECDAFFDMLSHPVKHPFVSLFEGCKELSVLICCQFHVVSKWKLFVLVVFVDFKSVFFQFNKQSIIFTLKISLGYHMNFICKIFFCSWLVDKELYVHDIIKSKIDSILSEFYIHFFKIYKHLKWLICSKLLLENWHVFCKACCIKFKIINTKECVKSLLIEVEFSDF